MSDQDPKIKSRFLNQANRIQLEIKSRVPAPSEIMKQQKRVYPESESRN